MKIFHPLVLAVYVLLLIYIYSQYLYETRRGDVIIEIINFNNFTYRNINLSGIYLLKSLNLINTLPVKKINKKLKYLIGEFDISHNMNITEYNNKLNDLEKRKYIIINNIEKNNTKLLHVIENNNMKLSHAKFEKIKKLINYRNIKIHFININNFNNIYLYYCIIKYENNNYMAQYTIANGTINRHIINIYTHI